MRFIRLVAPVLVVAGIAALVVGFLKNEATLNLFVIFPVITATGLWSGLGILLIIVGFLVLFFTWPASMGDAALREPIPSSAPATSSASEPAPLGTPPRRWGGVLLVGPIPVLFGSDPEMAKWMIVAGFVLLAALVVLTVIAIWGI